MLEPTLNLTHREAHRIVAVFLRLVQDQEYRLARGGQLRQEMLEAEQVGSDLSENYRFNWQYEAAVSCIKHLGGLGKMFNEAHPDDQLSAQDLVDVFAKAIVMLKKASGT